MSGHSRKGDGREKHVTGSELFACLVQDMERHSLVESTGSWTKLFMTSIQMIAVNTVRLQAFPTESDSMGQTEAVAVP